jgi:hypothetical protein
MNSSNKIVFMLLIAVLATIAGLALIFTRLYGDLGRLDLTGAATASAGGNVTLTIIQQTSITNQFQTIQFGSGFVNASCTVCYMDSNGGGNLGCCGTFNFSNNLGFLLENTGGVNLSVNYTCAGSCTAATLIGGTGPNFQIRTTNNSFAGQAGESGTLDTEGSCWESNFRGLNLSNNYTNVTAAGHWLCGNGSIYALDFASPRDAFVVDLNVSIPENAPAGTGFKAANFTFNALAVG